MTATNKRPRKSDQPAAAQARYFIVNPHGVIHEVDEEHARWRLRQPGYRQATLEEVRELAARDGDQRFDDPICEPWSPEPQPLVGLEALSLGLED